MIVDRSRSILSQLDKNRIDTNTQLNNLYDFIEMSKKRGKEININNFNEIKEITRRENTIFNEIDTVKEVLKSMFILNIDSNKIRSYARRDNSRLTYDAGNLSAVLDRLYMDVKHYQRRYRDKNALSSGLMGERLIKSKRKWETILETIGVIPEYKITDLTITITPPPYRDVIFTCIEQIEEKNVKIPATSLSDGTISIIAITTAVTTYPENSIIVIDEFDNGIHHSKAIKFLEKIQKIAKKKNITLVLTTHNTTLLNSLQGRDYKGINIIYREKDTSNSSILRFVDLQNYEKVIATGGIGKAVAKDGLLSYIEQEENKIELPSWLRGLE